MGLSVASVASKMSVVIPIVFADYMLMNEQFKFPKSALVLSLALVSCLFNFCKSQKAIRFLSSLKGLMATIITSVCRIGYYRYVYKIFGD